ncbi:MAG: alpha/beta hydrolase, partial [Phenylobacterium sp.]|uniref:alpha/beta fold hydrolase n=1 Tax=Phenylobacterium sp. TaxID=1871053 RepID=UPI001A5E087B
MTITTRTVEANGFRFAVDEAGEGDHLALCLHGFPESRFSWRFQLPLLAEMGYRVWAPDLRGYGETEPKPRDVADYAMERLMEDVAALIDASGARRVTLIGHDWGAGLAWSFAINRRRPLERLVIMNVPHPAVMVAHLRRSWAQLRKSWYMFFFQLPGIPERTMTANDARAIRQAFHGMAVDKTNFTDEVLDRYARDAQRPGAIRGMINWYRAAFRGSRQLSATQMIETPTLIVWGEED